ncbi:UDP-N-acetylmuramate--L-alanine ligase [Nocardioides guangzhouensis]|uniref:UDP-N-acetylmuramate--L-alanine ligase n=1 Tax=Nocardioides guangzhouensis TaxID=2497878 RepID=A0A4Q4Z766_9ACTN|nr:UDP-N-acetylmuramate--L-alanine ligase [Nocardioides guangzhouensis]RYP83338.1 UDP-N-acetylmuramate--L-alanine ligase [Nocardioides guangzhouensis]
MRIPVPEELLPADRLGRVHFVGIGGAGLSAIARIMLARGITVSGSDGTDSPTLQALRDLGATVHLGHDAAQVADADTLVVSTAVREDNPEVVAARAAGLRILPRSAGLASVMDGKRTVAVAGTHGKTTTTSLLTVALQAAGADPTYAIGGDLTSTGVNAEDGTGEVFVAEADESDGAFLVYSPSIAVVTNIDADHLDQWGTEEAYRAAFTDFLGRIEPGGLLVTWADDEATAALAERARERGLRVTTYGVSDGADLVARDLRQDGTRTTFTVARRGESLGELTLQIPGRHYVLNALAAIAVGLDLGHAFAGLRGGLESFAGTRRRMERKGEAAGVRVYDSYAHHPSEIRGDLEAARWVAGEGRLVVAFQPHLVSRTRIFGTRMGAELGAADEVVVCDVYLAREDADPDVTGRLVADAVPLADAHVHFEPDLDAVPSLLAGLARDGDLVLTLGAGTVTTVGPRVLELLEARG